MSESQYLVRVTTTRYDGEEVASCKHAIASGRLGGALERALAARLSDEARAEVRRKLADKLTGEPAVYEHWFGQERQLEIAVVPAHLLGEAVKVEARWL
jgi:hypothetical protein